MARIVSCVVCFTLLACAPKIDGLADEATQSTSSSSEGSGSESSGSESSGSESSGGTSESSSDESSTETGDDPTDDACPANPVLDTLSGIFDGIEIGYDYPEHADWVETCTVSAHAGDLLTGESITLDCVTGGGEAVMHTLELQASLVDAEQPTQIPAEIGESLQLSLWSEVWWAGGASWVLRDAAQLDDIRLIYYSTTALLTTDDAPAPAFLAPLELTLHDDICETYCPPHDDSGGFIPPTECDCEREQTIEFALGSDAATVQNGSAGAIGTSMFAFVETAKVFPTANNCADSNGAWYTFIVVAR